MILWRTGPNEWRIQSRNPNCPVLLWDTNRDNGKGFNMSKKMRAEARLARELDSLLYIFKQTTESRHISEPDLKAKALYRIIQRGRGWGLDLRSVMLMVGKVFSQNNESLGKMVTPADLEATTKIVDEVKHNPENYPTPAEIETQLGIAFS